MKVWVIRRSFIRRWFMDVSKLCFGCFRHRTVGIFRQWDTLRLVPCAKIMKTRYGLIANCGPMSQARSLRWYLATSNFDEPTIEALVPSPCPATKSAWFLGSPHRAILLDDFIMQYENAVRPSISLPLVPGLVIRYTHFWKFLRDRHPASQKSSSREFKIGDRSGETAWLILARSIISP